MAFTDRDLSWLSFNERILLEADNEHVPLMERLKFIAIYSSNLEEFYKVRVASHRFAQKYRGDKKNKYGYRPSFILQQINLIVSEQQERLGRTFNAAIVPGLSNHGIHLLSNDFTAEDEAQMRAYYDTHLDGNLLIRDITDEIDLQLKNQTIYLYALAQNRLYLIELDYNNFNRFVDISPSKEEQRIVQLDDIVKFNSAKFFSHSAEYYAVKISRDAELYIEEELENDIVKKIKKSIKNRDTGLPSRLLFDEDISFKHINALRKIIAVDMSGLIPGGRYHNFYDFFGFPVSKDKVQLFYPEISNVPSPRLDNSSDWFLEIKKEDVFLSFPYQSYHYVSTFLKHASTDPAVEEINITLYRVASTSEVCQALEVAAKNGKKVFVLDEVQARFDEESNIYWGDRLTKAGATVKYGVKNLKVHAKVFTVKRREQGQLMTYVYLGTGNFNEKTARVYGDHALLSTNTDYAQDLDELFAFLKDSAYTPKFKSLLVAPFNLRSILESFIDNEIDLVKQGKQGKITLKLNSLEDNVMIKKLRQAGDKGVQVDLIVRGICCYHPETKLQEKNIQVVSVIDQYLEHTRIYHFHNDGDSNTYLASADWMTRNLSKRVEVAFPVNEQRAKTLLISELDAQLQDAIKGRYVTGENENQRLTVKGTMSSQHKMFELVRVINE
ncbi:MAG: polyphosphate kinase [Bacteroidia bacterium]|jgi:polyphosphate kinase